MKNARTIIIALITLTIGVLVGNRLDEWRSDANEGPENRAQALGLAADTQYTPQNAFISGFYTQPTTYIPDYDAKNRCRVEYLFIGGAENSRPQDVIVNVDQEPGTPGGTSATGETVLMDFYIYRYKVVSNYELSLEQMQALAEPPKGWLLSEWSEDRRYKPTARKTFENCVLEKPMPQR